MSRLRRRKSDFSIQLTPMIDVMTVLLAVFMVTTPMMTTGIDLELPRAGTVQWNNGKKRPSNWMNLRIHRNNIYNR